MRGVAAFIQAGRHAINLDQHRIVNALPPGVLDELKRRLPKNEHGNRRAKLWQLLTVDTGIPHLDKQLTADVTLMQISDNKKQTATAAANLSQKNWELEMLILSSFPNDPRSSLTEVLFALLLTLFCLFVGRLIRGMFLGQLRSLFLWHAPMIAQLKGPRRGV